MATTKDSTYLHDGILEPKTLIVDRDKEVRESLANWLNGSGYTCTLVSDTVEAREFLRGGHSDLVVCSINGNDGSDLDFARNILAECPRTALVFVRASDDAAVAEYARELGVPGCITKPLDPTEVVICMDNAVHRLESKIYGSADGERPARKTRRYSPDDGNGSLPRKSGGECFNQDVKRYRELVESAQDIFCVTDARGYIKYVNPIATEMLGYARDELIGKDYLSFVNQDYQKTARRLYTVQLARKIPNTYWEFPAVTKDGKETWLGQNVQPIMDGENVLGFQTIARNINDRKRLDEDRLKFLEAVEQTSSIVMITDTQGQIEYVNPKMTEVTGYSKEELIGNNLEILKPGLKTPGEYKTLWRTITSGRTWRGQIQNRNKSGETYWESASISPIRNKEGEITHFLVIMEDITELKRSEEKLEEANRELEEINQQLEKAIEKANKLVFAAEAASISKSEFLANMSHEIRTPLNGIIGMTELALDTRLTAEQQEYLRIVKASADSLLTLINDILDFSKIEAKRLDLDIINFDLRDTLGDTLKTLALRAHEKSLELTCHVLPDVPEALVGDPGRLRQIVVNLVGNAIKFTDQGEVILDVQIKKKSEDTVCLHFSVKDTGVGITPEKLKLIFEPFAQADGSATRRHRGTGLGLAISSHLVEMMGGEIWVESEVGKGSIFHFMVQFGLQKVACPKIAHEDVVEVRDLPVLVVDDNETNRRVLEEILGSWGMKPTVVESAQAALLVIEASKNRGQPFPLVIMDANMPHMDGFTLAEEIKKRAELKSATIMMLTSAGLRGDAARCRELGVAAYLTKPIKHSYLLDAIMIAMGNRGKDGGPTDLITRHFLRKERPQSSERGKRALHILLAEDNMVNQKLVIRLLEKKGHTVDVVEDGRAVLEAVDRKTHDLILMDLQMPEMDGLAATAAIREKEKETGDHMPIIALTAHAMSGDRERCLKAGMDGYVSKPIEPERLFETINDVLPVQDEEASNHSEEAQPQDDSGEAFDEYVIDFSALSARVDGDKELLQEIVSIYQEDCPQIMSQIREAIAKECACDLERAAHTLKGAVGNLGARAAHEAALRLETIARSGDLTDAEEALSVLEREITRFNSAVTVIPPEDYLESSHR
jgi:PAS domain S-box-containing protein